MCAANRLTVTMSVSFRATLAYGSGQGNVGLREKSRTITFGQKRTFEPAPEIGRSWPPVSGNRPPGLGSNLRVSGKLELLY